MKAHIGLHMLRLFCHVYQTRSVSVAAERCAISQSAVLPQFVWRNYPELGTFGRDSRDFKKALVARERRFGSRR